ncbi:868_t:CDS:1, partial [Ambispora gerdemannii]
ARNLDIAQVETFLRSKKFRRFYILETLSNDEKVIVKIIGSDSV